MKRTNTARGVRISSPSLLLAAMPRAAAAQDWPSFRGPHARGVADGHALAHELGRREGRARPVLKRRVAGLSRTRRP